jgi:DoxX-like family
MTRLWAGRILTGLAVLFLLFDALIKLLKAPFAVAPTVQLGYPETLVRPIGVIELLCLALYVFPPTSILGAVVLTGYLGGAVATHLRVGDPLFSHVLFPIYIGLMIWGGLYLRDGRIRTMLSPQQTRSES